VAGSDFRYVLQSTFVRPKAYLLPSGVDNLGWLRRAQADVPPTLPDDPPSRRWFFGLNTGTEMMPWYRRAKLDEPIADELPVRPRWHHGLNSYFHVVTVEWLRRKPADEPIAEDFVTRPRWHPGMTAAAAPVVDNLPWFRRAKPDEPTPVDEPAKPRWFNGLTTGTEMLGWFKRIKPDETPAEEFVTKPRWFNGLNNYVQRLTVEWYRRQQPDVLPPEEFVAQRRWFPGLDTGPERMPWYRRKVYEDAYPEETEKRRGWHPGLTTVAPAITENLSWLRRQRFEEILPVADAPALVSRGWLGPQAPPPAAHPFIGGVFREPLVNRGKAFQEPHRANTWPEPKGK
jgi:hypothetical protein